MQQPRVFFPILSSRFDTESAEDYGERVHLLTTESLSPFNGDAIARIFRRELQNREYDPDSDYVALTGPTIFVAVFLGIVLATYRRARILMFDARTSRYVERVVHADDAEPVPLKQGGQASWR